MKISVIIKKLSNPRVRRRLKIALSVYGVAILLGVLCKVVYDIGFFNAQALVNSKKTQLEIKQPVKIEVLTMDIAQRIVTGALKEDPRYPQTVVDRVIDNNHKIAAIVIKNNNSKRVAWIIDMRLFFVGDLFNEEGYNLTKGMERQHNINHADY